MGAIAHTAGRMLESQTLHHYTSIVGAEGIIKSNSIWASLLHFMNDSQEWLYTLDIVRENLANRFTQRSDPYWIQFLAELRQSLQRIEWMNICVCSFSAVPNQLSQWRAYCPPDGGYELSFDVEKLKSHLSQYYFKLEECIYDRASQRPIVDEVVSLVIDSVSPIVNEGDINGVVGDVLMRLAGRLSLVAPKLKHPDFREEQEWRAYRLVANNDPQMSYHIRGSLLVPHYIIGFGEEVAENPIANVMAGPNTHQNLAIRGLETLTLNTNITVTASDTPLRKF